MAPVQPRHAASRLGRFQRAAHCDQRRREARHPGRHRRPARVHDEYDLAIEAYVAANEIFADPDMAEKIAFLQQEYGFRAQWVDVYPDRDEPRACIQFSDALPTGPAGDLAPYVRLEPAVPYELSVEGYSLCLNGARHGDTYTVTVLAGLPAEFDGARTFGEFTYAIAVENRVPSVSLRGSSYVLPQGGEGTVPVSTVNVDLLDVEVLRINDRNLIDQVVSERVGNALEGWTVDEIRETQGETIWQGQMPVERVLNREVTTGLPVCCAMRSFISSIRATVYSAPRVSIVITRVSSFTM